MDALGAYLARVGLADRDRSSLTLDELVAAHLRHIPFETLDPVLGVPVDDLSWEALTDKLVLRRRGGYCYEHDSLFAHVLRALGHEVEILSGRVEWGGGETVAARTHVALVVTSPGDPTRRLVDVGFGGQTLPSPIDYDSTEAQPTRLEPYRLTPRSDARVLSTLIAGEWRTLYVLLPDPQEPVDLEVGSWYVSTHPSSGFRRGIRAARITDDARVNLMDDTLTTHHREHGTSRRSLDGPGEVVAVLREEFGIDHVDGLADAVARELARDRRAG